MNIALFTTSPVPQYLEVKEKWENWRCSEDLGRRVICTNFAVHIKTCTAACIKSTKV